MVISHWYALHTMRNKDKKQSVGVHISYIIFWNWLTYISFILKNVKPVIM
jgi:hypothetical protein